MKVYYFNTHDAQEPIPDSSLSREFCKQFHLKSDHDREIQLKDLEIKMLRYRLGQQINEVTLDRINQEIETAKQELRK